MIYTVKEKFRNFKFQKLVFFVENYKATVRTRKSIASKQIFQYSATGRQDGGERRDCR